MMQNEDLPSIYEVPVNMQNQGLDTAILRKMGEPIGEKPALGPSKTFLNRRNKAARREHRISRKVRPAGCLQERPARASRMPAPTTTTR